jgi:hypothetical protein
VSERSGPEPQRQRMPDPEHRSELSHDNLTSLMGMLPPDGWTEEVPTWAYGVWRDQYVESLGGAHRLNREQLAAAHADWVRWLDALSEGGQGWRKQDPDFPKWQEKWKGRRGGQAAGSAAAGGAAPLPPPGGGDGGLDDPLVAHVRRLREPQTAAGGAGGPPEPPEDPPSPPRPPDDGDPNDPEHDAEAARLAELLRVPMPPWGETRRFDGDPNELQRLRAEAEEAMEQARGRSRLFDPVLRQLYSDVYSRATGRSPRVYPNDTAFEIGIADYLQGQLPNPADARARLKSREESRNEQSAQRHLEAIRHGHLQGMYPPEMEAEAEAWLDPAQRNLAYETVLETVYGRRYTRMLEMERARREAAGEPAEPQPLAREVERDPDDYNEVLRAVVPPWRNALDPDSPVRPHQVRAMEEMRAGHPAFDVVLLRLARELGARDTGRRPSLHRNETEHEMWAAASILDREPDPARARALMEADDERLEAEERAFLRANGAGEIGGDPAERRRRSAEAKAILGSNRREARDQVLRAVYGARYRALRQYENRQRAAGDAELHAERAADREWRGRLMEWRRQFDQIEAVAHPAERKMSQKERLMELLAIADRLREAGVVAEGNDEQGHLVSVSDNEEENRFIAQLDAAIADAHERTVVEPVSVELRQNPERGATPIHGLEARLEEIIRGENLGGRSQAVALRELRAQAQDWLRTNNERPGEGERGYPYGLVPLASGRENRELAGFVRNLQWALWKFEVDEPRLQGRPPDQYWARRPDDIDGLVSVALRENARAAQEARMARVRHEQEAAIRRMPLAITATPHGGPAAVARAEVQAMRAVTEVRWREPVIAEFMNQLNQLPSEPRKQLEALLELKNELADVPKPEEKPVSGGGKKKKGKNKDTAEPEAEKVPYNLVWVAEDGHLVPRIEDDNLRRLVQEINRRELELRPIVGRKDAIDARLKALERERNVERGRRFQAALGVIRPDSPTVQQELQRLLQAAKAEKFVKDDKSDKGVMGFGAIGDEQSEQFLAAVKAFEARVPKPESSAGAGAQGGPDTDASGRAGDTQPGPIPRLTERQAETVRVGLMPRLMGAGVRREINEVVDEAIAQGLLVEVPVANPQRVPPWRRAAPTTANASRDFYNVLREQDEDVASYGSIRYAVRQQLSQQTAAGATPPDPLVELNEGFDPVQAHEGRFDWTNATVDVAVGLAPDRRMVENVARQLIVAGHLLTEEAPRGQGDIQYAGQWVRLEAADDDAVGAHALEVIRRELRARPRTSGPSGGQGGRGQGRGGQSRGQGGGRGQGGQRGRGGRNPSAT